MMANRTRYPIEPSISPDLAVHGRMISQGRSPRYRHASYHRGYIPISGISSSHYLAILDRKRLF
jgi:hypothetical protein